MNIGSRIWVKREEREENIKEGQREEVGRSDPKEGIGKEMEGMRYRQKGEEG